MKLFFSANVMSKKVLQALNSKWTCKWYNLEKHKFDLFFQNRKWSIYYIVQYIYMRKFSPLDFYIFCTILPHFSVLHVEHKLLVKFFFLKSSSSGLCFLYYENWGGFCSERIFKLITWWTFFSLLGWTHTCPINHVRYYK